MKSNFGFDFDHLPEICTLFCIKLPNFVQIEAPTAEIWRHIHFSIWRPQRLNTTSGFVSVDVTAFRRSKSISKPNFVYISQMEAEVHFYGNPKWLGKWWNFFSKSRMCQYPGMLCYILWIQKCIFDACRQLLHNSGLICNQATNFYLHIMYLQLTVVDWYWSPVLHSFLPRDAIIKRSLCRHAVSVCLSVCPCVCHVRAFCQNE